MVLELTPETVIAKVLTYTECQNPKAQKPGQLGDIGSKLRPPKLFVSFRNLMHSS